MILQRTKSNSLTSISVKPTTRSVRSKRKRRRRNEHRNIYIKHSHTARNDSLLRVRTVLRGGTFSLQLSGVPLLLRQTSEGCKRPRRSCGTFKKLSPRRIVAPQKEITPCAPHSHFSLSACQKANRASRRADLETCRGFTILEPPTNGKCLCAMRRIRRGTRFRGKGRFA